MVLGDSFRSEERYAKALDYFARSYAKLAALLEEEYIFNWLSWDGDNMLASGAILDYGSIRQFAAKHDKYRFKDVDRYSASLAEQRGWARRWSRFLRKRWVSSVGCRREPQHVQKCGLFTRV